MGERVNKHLADVLARLLAHFDNCSSDSAPDGDCYRDFGTFKICGSGQFPTTALTRGMKAFGKRID